MNAVQRYPMDFDGAIVGAPVNPMTRLHAGSLYNSIFAHKDPANYIPAGQVRDDSQGGARRLRSRSMASRTD